MKAEAPNRRVRPQNDKKVAAGEAFFGLADDRGVGHAGAHGVDAREFQDEPLGVVVHGGGGVGHFGHGWAAVRVFPKPDYRDGFSGVRSDFRDTVHWEPTIQTDEAGEAEIRFLNH